MNVIDWNKLAAPFPANDIEWRLQSCGVKTGSKDIWGKCLAYVTNRAIQQRFDDVVGPDRWMNEYSKGPDGGILCGISVLTANGWVKKYDGAGNTAVEAVKGGLSDSMKRAAVQWGPGRYLYNLEEGWADVCSNGKFSGKTKDGTWFKWNPPKLPVWALPQQTAKPSAADIKRSKDISDLIKAAGSLEQVEKTESSTVQERGKWPDAWQKGMAQLIEARKAEFGMTN